jgi:hypothetical protein
MPKVVLLFLGTFTFIPCHRLEYKNIKGLLRRDVKAPHGRAGGVQQQAQAAEDFGAAAAGAVAAGKNRVGGATGGGRLDAERAAVA